MFSRTFFVFVVGFLFANSAHAGRVSFSDKQLYIDGKAAPFLYGAEVQYFRARGGAGRNVSPEVVKQLWTKLADRVLEAGMNTVIFYIPWDFHEPVEGTFDFDGTLDQDGDGKPDYPSRNVKAFLDLMIGKGIRHIMVRPGPYINAEWGPTGFGAIPKWFLDNYPESLAKTQTEGRPKTVSYGDAVYLAKARTWLKALHEKVLKPYLGTGKPVAFLQLDNETNYFWDSIYERDWNPASIARYQGWLKTLYRDIAKLNAHYGTKLTDFSQVKAPRSQKDATYANKQWHYDWYHFHDVEIANYYDELKKVWDELGVGPDVLYTSCDSFNALDFGLLPRLDLRAKTSFTTMNIYPKTFGKQSDSTMNTPMKAAHDAILVGSAHEQFWGSGKNWIWSTETVGGWFPPTEVSLATRQHTYGSLLGSGAKAITIYYFHEGWNWDGTEKQDSELHFDAPLDKDMNPRPAFALLKEVGASLKNGLGEAVVKSTPTQSQILIAQNNSHQYPVPGPVDALKVSSTDSAALFGYFREAGEIPDVAYLDEMTNSQLQSYRLVVWQDRGYLLPKIARQLQNYVVNGGTLLAIGDVKVEEQGLGKVIKLAKNPAEGWNDDGYTKQTKVQEALFIARQILTSSGIKTSVEVSTVDKQPFVHAWIRRVSPTKRLLFVENFLRAPRSATIRIAQRELPVSSRLRLAKKLGGSSTEISVASEKLSNDGVPFTLIADGVETWEIEAAP